MAFDHVTFTYPGADEPVLKDVSFECRAGEVTAIIGRTGCGKSSILKLIPRLYDATVGHVYVDDMNNVMEVQAAVTDMGYEAHSSMQWLEQAQEQMDMIQAVLGGIGAVSLFVAAIGIANTMMMSIYERTREIGVLKVLGCALGDIRSMFLIEAGFIGLMGGAAGLLLSYGVSSLINKFLGSGLMGMGGGGGDISRIPMWLSAAAVGFAIVIGMLAGLFPALRAMKLSPLAAIRNE